MKELKKLLGNNAHWTINKELAKDIGLDATIVLQHFIDLQYSFFEDGGFYQQQDRLLQDLPLTIDYLRKAIKVLKDKGFLSVVKKGVPAKNHYTVHEENILSYLSNTTRSVSETPLEVSQRHDKKSTRNTTNTKNKNSKNINTNSDDERRKEIYVKLYWNKLIPMYPQSRIGNRQHGIKKWLDLEEQDMKLAIKNLNRYLKIAGPYVKSLQNYITERCFTEEWFKSEKETRNKKNDINDTKTFDTDY